MKKKRIDFRTTEERQKKLLAICQVEKRCKTRVLEDLIDEKFVKNAAYNRQYLDSKWHEK